jgi:hypothetical protein
MDRLTARNKDGIAYLVKVKSSEQTIEGDKNTLECIYESMQKLANYEDMEEKAIKSITGKNKVLNLLAELAKYAGALDVACDNEYLTQCIKNNIKELEVEVQNG